MSSDDLPKPTPLPSTARRRLLRGVMAGAAVLPVGAGAQAVASNLRCVNNTVDPNYQPASMAGGRAADKLSTDNISRIALYRSTQTTTQGNKTVTSTRFWVKGADLVALKGLAPVGLPAGVTGTNWLLSSSDLSGDVPGATSSTPAAYLSTGWTTPTQDTSGTARFVAVRFDGVGNILGTSDYITSFTSPVNNSAIHRTCWSSFAGVNFSALS